MKNSLLRAVSPDSLGSSLQAVLEELLAFEPYVLLPLLMFLLSQLFRVPLKKALRSCLTIGIGFIGIFIMFGYFVEKIGPAVQDLTARTGLSFSVLDVGWPPLAAAAWAHPIAPAGLLLLLAVNALLVMKGWLKTVNIDIWNYWHFIFTGVMVFQATGGRWLPALGALTATAVITEKIADWSARQTEELSGLPGVTITTIPGIIYYPLGVLGTALLARIPGIRRISINPEILRRRMGLLGDPMVIGFLLGLALGAGAGYSLRQTLTLAFQIAAVVFILPRMCAVLSEGLMPISESMKEWLARRFPDRTDTLIGLDLAVILGNTSILVTGLLLMPVALFFAFLLPGVNHIPLGDLANMMAAASFLVVGTNRNILRAFLLGIPMLAGNILIASRLAGLYTRLIDSAGITFDGYSGPVTSFLDGGNLVRFWLFDLFQGRPWALLFLPAAGLILYLTRQLAPRINPGKGA